jgi:OmpA-OmpF porin, OOP family
MTESRIWAGGLLAILLLALLCTWVHYTPESGTTLSGQAAGGLTSAANTPPTSPAASPATTNATAPTTEPANSAVRAVPALALRAEFNAGVITLGGDVPDEASKLFILDRAKRLYGANKVIDKLRIEGAGKPAGFDAFAANFPPDLRDTLNGQAYAQSGRLVLEGEVANLATKARIEEGAAKAYGASQKIDSRLTVKQATQTATDSGATPATSPATRTGTARSTVNFGTSSALLSKRARLALREVARDLKNYDSGTRLGLVGFADSRGSDVVNVKLSERRALSVKTYLTKLGVSPERLSIDAKGSAEPIANNDSVDGRRQNRRVEVRLLSQ